MIHEIRPCGSHRFAQVGRATPLRAVVDRPGSRAHEVLRPTLSPSRNTQHALRNTLLLILTLGTSHLALAQSNLVYGYVRNYSRVAQPRVTVTLTCLYPDKRTEGLDDIRRDPLSTRTDTNGYYAFTNLLWGKYQRDVAGVIGTPYIFYVGTNTIGTVPITSLTTNQDAMPMNSATNYPTLSQVEALIEAATASSSDTDLSRDESAWYAFGAPFYGGQDGWPPNGTEQNGHLVGTADGVNWTGGDSYPEFTGTNGLMRDIAGLRIAANGAATATNYWSWTTSLTPTNASRLPLWISTNMHPQTSGWLLTNIDFSMNGDSNRVAYCWSPTLTLYVSASGDTNVLMTASVSTNNAAWFEQRATIWNVTNFPYGPHSAVEKIKTGMTNSLDLTPSFDWASGTLYFAAKDENSKYVVLGRFTTNTPGSLATTNVLKGDHSGWGLGREGVFFLRCPDGSLNLYMQKYDYDYSIYPGHGHVYCFAKSSATNNAGYFGPWSSLTNCNFAIQNPASFKPIFLADARSRNEAVALVGTTSKKRGLQWVAGKIGAGTNGFTGSGDFSSATNDWAGYGVGTEIEPLGGFGTTANGVTHFFSYTNDFFSQLPALDLHSNVKETMGMSNSGVAFHVPVSASIFSGSGANLTAIPISAVTGQSTTNTIVAANLGNISSLTNNLEDVITNGQSGATLGAPTFTGVVISTNLDQRYLGARPVTNVLSFLGANGATVDSSFSSGPAGVRYDSAFDSGYFTGEIIRGYRTNILTFSMVCTNTTSIPFTLEEVQANAGFSINAKNSMSGAVAGTSSATTNVATMAFTNVVATGFTNAVATYRLINGASSISCWALGAQSIFLP